MLILILSFSEQEVIKKIMLEPMPKKRFISIEEVTAATEFLIGDAARNITGQTVAVRWSEGEKATRSWCSAWAWAPARRT